MLGITGVIFNQTPCHCNIWLNMVIAWRKEVLPHWVTGLPVPSSKLEKSSCLFVDSESVPFWNISASSRPSVYFAILKCHITTYIMLYIITQVICSFGLVLAYDLLEDRRIDDDSTRFIFCLIFWILNLNQSQFFAKHSNQSVRFSLYGH